MKKIISLLLVSLLILSLVPAASAVHVEPIVMDFMGFAEEASQQSFWSGLLNNNVAGAKTLGATYDVEPSSTYKSAVADMDTWLNGRYNWDIPDLVGNYTHKHGARYIYLDPASDYFGLRFYTHFPNNNSTESKMLLTVDVPAGMGGEYTMDVEGYYEAAHNSAVPSYTGADNGGAKVVTYINGTEVGTFHQSPGNDTGEWFETDRVGSVTLKEGTNEIKFWVVADRNNYPYAGRCALNLSNITFTPVSDCDHADAVTEFIDNGNRSHQEITTCPCGFVYRSGVQWCEDWDGDDKCDTCGYSVAIRPKPEREFASNVIVMDFMDFAYEAAQQSWWRDLNPSATPDIMSIGVLYGTEVSATHVQAIKDVQSYLDTNYNWTVEDLTDGSSKYTHTYGGRQIYMDARRDYYGIRFYTHLPGEGHDISNLRLLVDVPEGKAGTYAMEIETFDEAVQSVVPMSDSWDNGGATCDIYVNGTLVKANHCFASNKDEIRVLSLSNVELKEGTNSIVFEVIADRNGYPYAGRCALNLRYITFTPQGLEDVAKMEIQAPAGGIYTNEEINLTAIGYDADGRVMDLSKYDLQWSVDDDTVASIDKNGTMTGLAEGVVTVTAKLGGTDLSDTAEVYVLKGKAQSKHMLFDFTYNRFPNFATRTISTHDIAMNRSLTYNSGNGMSVNSRGLQIYTPKDGIFALDIRVPASGWYEVELRGSSEVDTILAHGILDDAYIGSIDYSHGGTNNARGGYNTVWLDAGVHTLKLKAAASGQQVLGGVFLYASSDPNEVQAIMTAEKTELVPGQKMTMDISFDPANDETFTLFPVSSDPGYTNYYTLSSSNTAVLTVSGTTVTAKAAGTADVILRGEADGNAISERYTVTVKQGKIADAKLSAAKTTVKPTQSPFNMVLTTYGTSGAAIGLPSGATVQYASGDTSVATVSSSGKVTLTGKEGSALITAIITEGSHKVEASCWITVTNGKTENTVYTDEERAAAQKNAKFYSWAYKEKNNAVAKADLYVENLDLYYEQVLFPQTWPGSNMATYTNDDDYLVCAYCRTNLSAYGSYPYIVDPINKPWKITCPACHRDFPSNDFGSYYRSGIGSDGKFHAELADKSYLTNVLYPEKGAGWGVDDGWGWKRGTRDSNGTEQVYTFISYYIRGATYPIDSSNHFIAVLDYLRDAYLYTGNEKYGNAGAILVDRLADIYDTYDISDFPIVNYADCDGFGGAGIQFGHTWDGAAAIHYAKAAAAFWDCMDNAEVVNYIAEKAAWKGLEASDITPEYIRSNVDENLLLKIWKYLQTDDISGNVGIPEAACAYTAVALDRLPESKDMLDWLFADRVVGGSPTNDTAYATGGGVMNTIMSQVKRDGLGAEGSLSYNSLWETGLMDMYEALDGYTTVPSADMWKNSKVVTMYHAAARLMTGGMLGPNLHETSGYGYQGHGIGVNVERMTTAFVKTGDPMLARAIYAFNGNSVSGLHGDIFTTDPEDGIQEQILAIVEEQGEWDMAESDMMPHYGIALLKEGPARYLGRENADQYSTYWMYYGDTKWSHHQREILNLDLDAFGLTLSGNMGYPVRVDSNPERLEWVENTISNNTVVVDDLGQVKVDQGGYAMHFADDGYAKVMDADVPHAYESTDIYRRTVVAVDNGDGVHYAVDFFRVLGGTEHVYSFHAASMTDPTTSGLSMVKQSGGTYMGQNVPYGADPTFNASSGSGSGSGYSWLYNVSRDKDPDTVFSVNWPIKDFYNRVPNSSGIRLKLTMLSEEPMTEVALADGKPPQNGHNPEHLEFMMVRRSGSHDLDTLFTTVMEPYKNSSYIASSELVPMTLKEGAETVTDRAAAIKVTLTSGREDYIVYATNTACTYRVDDLFDFKGFTGVVSYENGNVTYAWGNDAELVADVVVDAVPRISGEVLDFTKGLADSYEMTISMDHPMTAEQLKDKWIYVENDRMESGAYRIYDAKVTGNTAVIDLRFQTLIRSYLDNNDLDRGFRYNISEGDSYVMPLSNSGTESAIEKFDIVGSNMTLGNELKLNIMANTTDLEDGYYARITHNGNTVEADFARYNSIYSCVSITMAAAQMADEVTVEVFDEDGNAVSNVYTNSIRNYAMGQLNKATNNAKTKTLLVDMLNYGAAAQSYFQYAEDDLANSLLTDEQKLLATAPVETADHRVQGENYYGSNLSLENKILLNFFFKGVTEGMYAEVSFGTTTVTMTFEEIEKYNGNIYKIPVDDTALAESFELVTVTVYNADGTVHGTATDSVESYIARNAVSDLNEAIMKFAASAKVYFS